MSARRSPWPALALALALAACAGSAIQSDSQAPDSQAPATPAPNTPAPPASPPVSRVVALSSATGNDVSVEILAPEGLVLAAELGDPTDGASVGSYRLLVGNDEPNTLRLSWTGGPCDARDVLTIDPELKRILLIQPECSGDALAFDRVLVVHLAVPTDADAWQSAMQDGLDTAG